ncbi:MAG: hypothetical protein ABI151_01845 [Chitinophagaceae bacterium]
MPLKFLALVLVTFFLSGFVNGQDTLPKFTVLNKGNERIVVSWTNPYDQRIRQLSIQRSLDSLKGYKTILTVPDPTVFQNGYVDSKAINDHMFYRLYILLDSGKFIFSAARRPIPDTARFSTSSPVLPLLIPKDTRGDETANSTNITERLIYVKKRDSLIGVIPEKSLKTYRAYLTASTRDTISMKTPDTLLIRPFVPKEFYRPSKFVFTEKDGNIRVILADAATRKYSIKFFEEDNTEVFEVEHVREPMLILDKTNFFHSGWFIFEIYEDGKVKERHKLFVPRD